MNGPERYRTLSAEGSFEFTEKKSRFIGFAAPALLEEDALKYIDTVKARHPQCSAVLYAYLSGFQGTQQRFFDAHEPSGGLMMLEALKRQQVTGAVTAVVRYYGGIQLGAGPLGRAFGRAAAEAIAQAQPCMVEHTTQYEVCLDYTLSGKLEHWFEHSPHRLQGLEYGEQVKAHALVRATQQGRFLADMADMTAGQAKPQALSECYLRWE